MNCLLFLHFYNSKPSLNISFICFHFKANEIKTLFLNPVSIGPGLMDPPNQLTNNDLESGNFIIKHDSNSYKQKSQEVLEKVKKEIINMQFRNENREVFGKDFYKPRKEFEKNDVNDLK